MSFEDLHDLPGHVRNALKNRGVALSRRESTSARIHYYSSLQLHLIGIAAAPELSLALQKADLVEGRERSLARELGPDILYGHIGTHLQATAATVH